MLAGFCRLVARPTFLCWLLTLAPLGEAHAGPLKILSVDVTPLVSPGDSRFGPQNTMGMALQKADSGGLFSVTEVTPLDFQAMTSQQLSTFRLIAINNHPERIAPGLGTTWHDVVGIESGGRVFLSSHDAVRFHFNVPPGGLSFENPGPGVEPFGADDLVREAALWAGGIPGTTGLLIFNDAPFISFAGGQGWGNEQLNLPAEWGIGDLDPFAGFPLNGDGYTDIVPAFEIHPLYQNLSDLRFGVDSINSFGGNITAASFHTVFGSYDAGILRASEVLANAGDPNPGNFPVGDFNPPMPGLDGRAIALIREASPEPVTDCNDGLDNDLDGLVDHPEDPGCRSAVDLSEGPDCSDGFDNDGDTFVDYPAEPGCASPGSAREDPQCQDGIDNDGDGRIDFDGGQSIHGPCVPHFCPVEVSDPDLDGTPDPDPQCVGAPARNRERRRCGLGFELLFLLIPPIVLRAARKRRLIPTP